MWPKGLVMGGVILGLLLGVWAFWQTRGSRTPPSRLLQEKSQRAKNGKATPGDATSSEQEKSRPQGPTETAPPPQDRGLDQPQPDGSTGGTPPEPKSPTEPSQHPQEPKPSEPKEPGTLSVYVQPWAEVWVDGRSRGETPLELELSPGKHKVILIYENQRTTHTVTIRTGRLTHLIHAW